MNRREALRGLALLAVGCARGRGDSGAGLDTASGCSAPSDGTSNSYCLVEGLVVRVSAGASLAVGSTLLSRVDDNTAVLVGRDAEGYFARSAICTHACCLVALCDDEACASPNSSPDLCETAGPVTSDRALCPCHGSVFRVSDGVAMTGPATTPLPAYSVTTDGDDLLVDTGTEIEISVRTPA